VLLELLDHPDSRARLEQLVSQALKEVRDLLATQDLLDPLEIQDPKV